MSDNGHDEATPLLKSINNKNNSTDSTDNNALVSEYRIKPVIKQVSTYRALQGDSYKSEIQLLQLGANNIKTMQPLLSYTWLAAMGPLCGLISSGMTSGFSAVLLPQLELESSDISVTDDSASWITSSFSLSLAGGCSISGYFSDKFGRRRTHQMISVIIAMGWGLQAAAHNVAMLLAGRILAGIGIGIGTPLASVYLAEISSPRARGPILAAIAVCVATGILVSHILGTMLNWRLAAGIALVFPGILLLGATLSPESPTWLIAQNRIYEAERAFTWLRGNDEQTKAELKMMQRRHKNWDGIEHRAAGLKGWLSIVKPFLVMCSYFVVQQWSGINAVTFYSVSLFNAAVTGKGVLATYIVDMVRILAAVITCQIMWQYGRRPLTVLSGIGAGIVLIIVSVLLMFNVTSPYLLIFLLSIYIVFISLGLMPIPWIMIGEVFPFAKRGIISGITAGFCHIIVFSVVMTLPSMLSNLGPANVFLIYGLVALFGTLIVIIWLPETQNKTLDEIECNTIETTDDTENNYTLH